MGDLDAGSGQFGWGLESRRAGESEGDGSSCCVTFERADPAANNLRARALSRRLCGSTYPPSPS